MTIAFAISIALISYASNHKIDYIQPDTEKKYKETFFYKKVKNTKSNDLPPNLTDLNNSWKSSNISVTNILTDYIIKNAKEYLGVPYQYGGESINGIDCSALVKQVFKPYKFLPRISTMQAKSGIHITKDKLKKGDLVFFSINRKRNCKQKITHVGIVVEKKNGKILFIHASRSHGVMLSKLEDPYWDNKFIVGRRIFKDTCLKKSSQPKEVPYLLIVN